MGKKQSYSSGTFRENLIKAFLRELLPKSLSVDSGFIYGFGLVENSRQIDIIIWDSSNYGAIYRTDNFVIIPPESVLCIISVKSNMTKKDVLEAIENLSSVIKKINFRLYKNRLYKDRIFGPISKIFISYTGTKNRKKTQEIICNYYKDLFKKFPEYTKLIIEALQKINPSKPSTGHIDVINLFIVKLILAIESSNSSFYTGFGPPEYGIGDFKYGPKELKRIPYLYPQENIITKQIEKMIYYILSLVYDYLQVKGWSAAAAWGDIDPIKGYKSGSVYEIIEKDGQSLIDFENL